MLGCHGYRGVAVAGLAYSEQFFAARPRGSKLGLAPTDLRSRDIIRRGFYLHKTGPEERRREQRLLSRIRASGRRVAGL